MQDKLPFELLLFHRVIAFSEMCVDEGIDGLIIDFETKGKTLRQDGFDTEINAHTLKDLEAVRALSDAHILCRINTPGPDTAQEVARVLDAGADEIIVPMIRNLEDAQAVVEAVSGAARITLMVETIEATKFTRELCALPIDRIYVGLNDLHISRGTSTLFEPLIDGCLEAIRDDVQGVQFGFGGITLRGQGNPLPVHHFVGDLARLNADFTFLRRSFYRDVAAESLGAALKQMREDVRSAQARNVAQISSGFKEMQAAVQAVVRAQND